MAELLPCPFCGGEAKIVENGFGFADVSCKKEAVEDMQNFYIIRTKKKQYPNGTRAHQKKEVNRNEFIIKL